jgi:preprotein translocase SecE subunit
VAVARNGRQDLDSPPPPLEHASPDAELAEAQLALGRPELAGDQTEEEIEEITEAEEREEELASYGSPIPGVLGATPHVVGGPDELEEELELEDAGGRGGGRRGRSGAGFDGEGDGAGGGLVPAGAAAPEVRTFPGSRLVNFLRASWRELHRVQWPDRRQVVQATGVVIGFVIAAGLFLGAADWVSQKLVNFILTGH